MANNFQPSENQIVIFDKGTHGNVNIVVNAVAGSGKSTTILQLAKLLPSHYKILFLAFNKAVVVETALKIGDMPNVEVKTLHSLGASAVMGTFKSVLDMNKYKAYVNDALKFGALKPNTELLEEEIADYKQNIHKLVDLCRATLSSDTEQLEAIASKYLINVLDNEIEIALKVVQWGANNTNKIDFTDMIYFPNIKKLRMPQFDYVFIDECQDLNTAQRQLFLQCVAPNGKFVAVGDPKQAIYGFAGADIESFNILRTLPNTIELPLSVSYRCDASIVELAKSIVPQIQARKNAPNGTINRDAKLKDISDGDMVLCRNTAPLVQLCIQYIADGVKAYVKGKDVGLNLINMIKKTNRRNMDDVLERLYIELQKIQTKIVQKAHCTQSEATQDALYVSQSDKIRAIEVLSQGLKTADAVINRIEKIFKDNDYSGICLSTVHKAKGLEANNVYIICEEKFLPKRAMRVQWTAEQEYNLLYVAYTRAKHMLGFVSDFKFE